MLCFIALRGNSGKNTADEICTIYGNGTTTIRTVRNWFKKFRAGNFVLKDEDRSNDGYGPNQE